MELMKPDSLVTCVTVLFSGLFRSMSSNPALLARDCSYQTTLRPLAQRCAAGRNRCSTLYACDFGTHKARFRTARTPLDRFSTSIVPGEAFTASDFESSVLHCSLDYMFETELALSFLERRYR